MFNKKQPVKHIDYKFNEGALIAELKTYIDSTYGGHYSKNKFQSTEFISDCGHGIGFAIGNILKYAQRFGKKEGRNEKDLYKVIHYAIILLGQMADNDIRIRKQDAKEFEDHMQEGAE